MTLGWLTLHVTVQVARRIGVAERRGGGKGAGGGGRRALVTAALVDVRDELRLNGLEMVPSPSCVRAHCGRRDAVAARTQSKPGPRPRAQGGCGAGRRGRESGSGSVLCGWGAAARGACAEAWWE